MNTRKISSFVKKHRYTKLTDYVFHQILHHDNDSEVKKVSPIVSGINPRIQAMTMFVLVSHYM